MSIPLTEKEKAFCQQFARLHNAKEAAVRAGYSINRAQRTADRLLPVSYTHLDVYKRQDQLGVEEKKVEMNYKVGDSVKVIDGSLEGFVGQVQDLDVDNNSVKVLVSMFGRETPVELELSQVTALEN